MPGGTKRSSPAEARLSRAIPIARILCLFGMIYVHGWTGLTGGRLGRPAGKPVRRQLSLSESGRTA
jgi:hypothetical protein